MYQEGGRPSKSESNYIFANYGALDLSNDDAQNPDNEVRIPIHP